jgi:hypothetical protein
MGRYQGLVRISQSCDRDARCPACGLRAASRRYGSLLPISFPRRPRSGQREIDNEDGDEQFCTLRFH